MQHESNSIYIISISFKWLGKNSMYFINCCPANFLRSSSMTPSLIFCFSMFDECSLTTLELHGMSRSISHSTIITFFSMTESISEGSATLGFNDSEVLTGDDFTGLLFSIFGFVSTKDL